MLAQFKQVTKMYNKSDGLQNASFTVGKGEFIGLLGLNGSGKTTTLKLLAGLLQSDHGEILVNGSSPRSQRSSVSYLGDRPIFFDWMKPSDVNSFMTGLFPSFCHDKFKSLLQKLDVPQKAMSQMSKGQAQRLRLAALLSKKASLYLMDEPLSGIDLVSRDLISDVLKELKGGSASVILSTHEIRDVEDFFDRALYLKSGEIIQDLRKAELAADNEDFLSHFLRINKEGSH